MITTINNFGVVNLYENNYSEQKHQKKYEDITPSEEITTTTSPTNISRRRGNNESSLFIDDETAEREKQRFITFLRAHKLSARELDAALDNSVTQILVCYYRAWQQRNMLAPKAGGTAVTRFANNCGLSLTVNEKAYSNLLNRMIKSSDKYPDWNGDVRASF